MLFGARGRGKGAISGHKSLGEGGGTGRGSAEAHSVFASLLRLGTRFQVHLDVLESWRSGSEFGTGVTNSLEKGGGVVCGGGYGLCSFAWSEAGCQQ